MSFQRPPTLRELLAARTAIRSHVMRTPLRRAAAFGERYGCEVHLKLENWQPTGSFKVRGAVNLLSQLSQEERARGLVTASAGNHALAVGYAAQRLGIGGVTVFVPRTAPRAKIEKLKRFPITVEEVGETYDDAHRAAEEFGRARGATFIHAYDDARTVAGAGTIGFEVLDDLPAADAVLVPVGGGGLISGIALAVKQVLPEIKVYGVQPEASPALRDSLKERRALEEYAAGPTICDGLAGGIGRMVFEAARGGLVDEVAVVEEAETRAAIRALVETQQVVVEGSGAVGIAALLSGKVDLRGKRVAVVLSGGNIDLQLLAEIVAQ